MRLDGVHAPRRPDDARHHHREVADVRADIEHRHAGLEHLLDDEFLLGLAPAEVDELTTDPRILAVQHETKVIDRALDITPAQEVSLHGERTEVARATLERLHQVRGAPQPPGAHGNYPLSLLVSARPEAQQETTLLNGRVTARGR